MDKKDMATELPKIDVIWDKISKSNKQIPVSDVAGIVYDVVRNLVHEGREYIGLDKVTSDLLGLSLLSSIFMTILSMDLSREQLQELADECGVDMKHFHGELGGIA